MTLIEQKYWEFKLLLDTIALLYAPSKTTVKTSKLLQFYLQIMFPALLSNKIVNTLAKTLFIILLIAVLVECVLRVSMFLSWTSPNHIPDPDIGYRMRPNISNNIPNTNERLNSSGFNDTEHSRLKQQDTVRLAVIGDSFVYGVVPRPTNLTAVIQRLASEAGKKIEVLNMGIPGAGPKNYLRLVGKDAIEMQADWVGVMLFLGNDLIQSHPDFETRIWLGTTHEVLVKPYLLGWSEHYLSLYRTLLVLNRLLHERFRKNHEGTFSAESFLEIESQKAKLFEISPSTFILDGYSSIIEMTRQMMEISKQHGMNFFVVLAPDELQVNRSLQQEVIQTYGLNPENHDFNRLSSNLSSELEALGIPVLDLLPIFQASQEKVPLYAKQDTHWNEAGNQLAGEAIWAFISRHSQGKSNAVIQNNP